MRRHDLAELHYIVPIATVPSILERGILSHDGAARLCHADISMAEIQQRRANREIAPGRSIHVFANVYFNARNAMMYKRKDLHRSICVLRISPEAVDIRHSLIADQNGSSSYARFYPSPEGLTYIDRETIMAESWIHEGNDPATWRHKAQMCAELLVPNVISADLVLGAYVSGPEGQAALVMAAPKLSVTINAHLFFQG